MIRAIEWYPGERKIPIFLYLIVVNDAVGQYIVAMMISEIHNTVTLLNFLNEWTRLGAPHPKEFTSDGALAILTAAIRAFTQYSTIEKYNAACGEGEFPRYYIRVDIAHFIKLYVNFISKLTNSKKVRIFYKACIGQLTLCRSTESAKKILKAILVVAHCETDGRLLQADEDTECDKERNFLKNLLDPKELEEPDIKSDTNPETWPPNRPQDESIFYDPKEDDRQPSNFWSTWAEDINEEAKGIAESEIGEHDNAYHLPQVTERLMKDMKSFPLWSCILKDRIGYGKTPATSAAVESQIKSIKQDLFNNNKASPMRPDDFVHSLLSYVVGRSNIIEARAMEIDNVEKTNDDANVLIDESSMDCNKTCMQDFTQDHTNEILASTPLSYNNVDSNTNTDNDKYSMDCKEIHMEDSVPDYTNKALGSTTFTFSSAENSLNNGNNKYSAWEILHNPSTTMRPLR